jgi:hypothetical protein
MCSNPADPTQYYFVNFNKAAVGTRQVTDQIALLQTLIKNPLDSEKFHRSSEYAFYKYLYKTSVFPTISAMIKIKKKGSTRLQILKWLFFFLHFDLYLRASGVPEYIYNKYSNFKPPAADYYVQFIKTF